MTATSTLPQLLTREQAWNFLGIKRYMFFRLESMGQLPQPVRVPGGIRYRKVDLEKFVAALPARKSRYRSSSRQKCNSPE